MVIYLYIYIYIYIYIYNNNNNNNELLTLYAICTYTTLIFMCNKFS